MGKVVTAMIENKSVVGTIKRRMGRFVIVKCVVPERTSFFIIFTIIQFLYHNLTIITLTNSIYN